MLNLLARAHFPTEFHSESFFGANDFSSVSNLNHLIYTVLYTHRQYPIQGAMNTRGVKYVRLFYIQVDLCTAISKIRFHENIVYGVFTGLVKFSVVVSPKVVEKLMRILSVHLPRATSKSRFPLSLYRYWSRNFWRNFLPEKVVTERHQCKTV